jgi:ketosteroid isomerase-like protein
MSDANIEVLKRMYEAFNRGDIVTALSAIDSQIEWRVTAEASPSPKTYHGHSGVRSALSSLLEVWSDYRNEPLEFIAADDCVVVRLRSQATGKASGAEVSGEVAHLWEIRNGKAVRFEAYLDPEEALRAARRGDGS